MENIGEVPSVLTLLALFLMHYFTSKRDADAHRAQQNLTMLEQSGKTKQSIQDALIERLDREDARRDQLINQLEQRVVAWQDAHRAEQAACEERISRLRSEHATIVKDMEESSDRLERDIDTVVMALILQMKNRNHESRGWLGTFLTNRGKDYGHFQQLLEEMERGTITAPRPTTEG